MIRMIQLKSKDLTFDLSEMDSEAIKRIYENAVQVLSKRHIRDFDYGKGVNRELILKDAHRIKYAVNKYYVEYLI